MTITITKARLAVLVLAGALVLPATALATHVFDDVEDDKFYATPVAWAADNEITTGKSPTTFDPEGEVTRGESVTFLHRYDEKIVQPALDGKADADHDHDDEYLVEVITTDTAVNPDFVSERNFEPRAFTTTKDGRLEIKVSAFASTGCSPTSSAVRFFYLLLDGEPIEGSLLTTRATTAESMTIVGTTPDIIDAGDHTVSVSAECLGTDDAQGLTWSSDIMYQITVHAA